LLNGASQLVSQHRANQRDFADAGSLAGHSRRKNHMRGKSEFIKRFNASSTTQDRRENSA